MSDVVAGEWRVTATAEAAASTSAGRTTLVRLPNGASSGSTAYAPAVRVIAPGARVGV